MRNNMFLFVHRLFFLSINYEGWYQRFLLQGERDWWPLQDSNCLAWTTRKAGKCQVFLKSVRSYISLLLTTLFSSALCFHRLSSLDACLSQIMSVPPGWGARCDPPPFIWASTPLFLFTSLLILSSTPCFSDPFPLRSWWAPTSLYLSLSFSVAEFRWGWKSLSSELSGSAKGHSPNHLGWLWAEPEAVISGALPESEPKRRWQEHPFCSRSSWKSDE